MKKTKVILDLFITPQNAKKRGYEYVQDVFNPYEAIRELFELAAKQGYKFGNPSDKTTPDKYLGLYRLTKKHEK